MKDLHHRIILTIDEWLILKSALTEKGYKRFQTQYDAGLEEGFHAWFIGNGNRVEVITHNPEIQRDIIKNDI